MLKWRGFSMSQIENFEMAEGFRSPKLKTLKWPKVLSPLPLPGQRI